MRRYQYGGRATSRNNYRPGSPATGGGQTGGTHRGRAVIGGLLAAGAAVLLAWWLLRVATALGARVRSTVPLSPDESLTLVAALLGLGVATWLAVGVLLAVLAHLPGRVGSAARRLAEHVAPAVSRRVAVVIAGAALGGALAPGTATAGDAPPRVATGLAAAPYPSPAFAASAVGVSGQAAEDGPSAATPLVAGSPAFAPTDAGTPAPGWVPERPPVRPQPSTRLVSTPPSADERAGVVVHRGDTLWSIVRDHLGPEATDAEVAAEWPRWHAVNRQVIGPDADVLLPGQVLQPPGHPTGRLGAGAAASAPTAR
jgi:hypothetical protein